ncbi:MAG: hypothetical protein Q8W51_06970 [Candidatus Palauibacterales bacterium]|nr:hypothetical protein [Candidatus Palauibacterales bacterium]MDP2529462.1 hypothetical protein [Candidatus Palauibacterales bacterium]MDP2585190.1 hypothetical protein [Candidatus Palauibacterales bacterium]
MQRVTAIFDDMDEAEAAVDDLRSEGIDEDRIGLLTRHSGEDREHRDAKAAARGAEVGAGAGAIMGIAAAFIPGVGPFITAGVLTSWIGSVAGGAAAGAAVGGTTGALAGLLEEKAEYGPEEARAYAEAVSEGGVLVTVDTAGTVEEDEVLGTLTQHGGMVEVAELA